MQDTFTEVHEQIGRIPKTKEEEIRRAKLQVKRHAIDEEDEAMLLEELGLPGD